MKSILYTLITFSIIIVAVAIFFIFQKFGTAQESSRLQNQTNSKEAIDNVNGGDTNVDEPDKYKNQYEILFLNQPKFIGIRTKNAYEYELKFNIRNNDVDSMITNVGVDYCTVEYNGIKQNKSVDGSEFQLKKALVNKSETTEPLSFTLNISVDFLPQGKVSCEKDDLDSQVAHMCSYGDTGDCLCTKVNRDDIQILGCEFAITNDGKQAGNGWGKYPHFVSIK